MTTFLDKLNLSPFERRLVIIGIVVFALLLNYLAIWPYFFEWGQVDKDWDKQMSRRAVFLGEIMKLNGYEQQMKQLERAGAQVVPEEQANRLQITVNTAAQTHGVYISRMTPTVMPARLANQQTNQFFDEQVLQVDLLAKEDALVNFLYSLGAGDSMIRVREITGLRLDPTQQQLAAHLTLVASFQKKPRATTTTTQPAKPAGPNSNPPKPAGASPNAPKPGSSNPPKAGVSTNKSERKR